MNEQYTVHDLAYKCSDFAEHANKIIERVNSGDMVVYDKEQLDSTFVLYQLIDDDSDAVNTMLSSLSIHTPLSSKYAAMIDEKTQELAEEAARSYKGKYDE
jgi:uncharacterized membrane-anchored protein